MRKRGSALVMLLLLAGCTGPVSPTVVSPIPPLPTALPTATLPPAFAPIPDEAWSRPLGLPFATAGQSKATYPMIDDGSFQGLPLGGLGAGTIGRTYRGDFARWHVDLGKHFYVTVPADQFSVYMKQQDRQETHVLYAGGQPADTLGAWKWDYPVGAGAYYALYPFAWYDYANPAYPARLTVQQFSPIIPDNYQENSYPVAVFLWEVANTTTAPLSVTVMFTWQDLLSPGWTESLAGNTNHARSAETEDGLATGVVMSLGGEGAVDEEWKGTMAMAALERPGQHVTYRTRFATSGDGADVWNDLAADGALDDVADASPSTPSEPIGAALAVGVSLEPGQVISFPVVLAWDLPITTFDGGTQWYKKYTAYFGRDGQQAWPIALEALQEYEAWRAQIESWQRPILDDPGRPEWFKTALFNELYYLADGGTVWEAGLVGSEEPTPGHFAYLECFDYPFYNTFDVGFYSSWPLVMLWPEIEKTVIRDFAAAIPLSDPSQVTITYLKQPRTRKLSGATPHDMGSPAEDPWRKPNAFIWQDVNGWKDLNSKFVLQLYRDYVFTGDRSLVDDNWADARMALEYLRQFDRDGDGIPEDEGVPDQTYDTWTMDGTSAYVGSLWLAALEAAVEMARLEGDATSAAQYTALLQQGQATFERDLWNGKYYDFDTDSPQTHDSIMADQLIGQWYARSVGLPDVVPAEHARLALDKIFEYNVKRFVGGTMGAVNGMRPDGRVDTSTEQSQEVWVGTTYALAAGMYQEGLHDQAWQTAWGLYNVTYLTKGLWFRTPEAWDKNGNFRASMYMRPQAIWALEHAYRQEQSANDD